MMRLSPSPWGQAYPQEREQDGPVARLKALPRNTGQGAPHERFALVIPRVAHNTGHLSAQPM
eukprot:11123284-Lingulodinium_polyedra.AAC.1